MSLLLHRSTKVPMIVTSALCLVIAAYQQVAAQPEEDVGMWTSRTFPGDVAGLHSLFQAFRDPCGRLRSWQIGTDPCGAPNCSFPYMPPTSSPGGNAGNPMQLVSAHETMQDPPVVCNYYGISCTDWRVDKIILPCTKDSGSEGFLGQLPEYLSTMDALTVLDLERNYLSGSLPGKMGGMASLEVLRLGYNRLSGPLPAQWGRLTTLRILDLRGNALSGVLPTVWSGMQNLELLLVDHNALSGYLPQVWGSLRQLRILAVGDNNIVGGIPASWANMSNLNALDVTNACGICGALPAFPQAAIGQLQLETSGSSLGWTCNRPTCSATATSLLMEVVICVSIIAGMITLCVLRRIVQHFIPGFLYLPPTYSLGLWGPGGSRRSSRGPPSDVESTDKPEEPPPQGKGRAATVIFNPDGYTWSYGLEEKASAVGSPRHAAVGVQASAATLPAVVVEQPAAAVRTAQQQTSGTAASQGAAGQGREQSEASALEGQHVP